MMKFAVLASVLSAAWISANCANSGSVVSPSGADASAAALDAKRSDSYTHLMLPTRCSV